MAIFVFLFFEVISLSTKVSCHTPLTVPPDLQHSCDASSV